MVGARDGENGEGDGAEEDGEEVSSLVLLRERQQQRDAGGCGMLFVFVWIGWSSLYATIETCCGRFGARVVVCAQRL